MLRLTLVRHAKSSWADPDTRDFDRPLNARGRRDAPVMAARLRATLGAPDRIVSSPALRAITTARVFAGSLGIAPKAIVLQPRIYDASCGSLVDVVQGLDADAQHVLVFGHNPGFSELAHWLADCPFQELPTCAVASLELRIDAWRELVPQCGTLQAYLYPKDGDG
jgi:phosphohistidine phosphatase